MGEYDNTLIVYIQGDNGASQENGFPGTKNNYAALNGNAPTLYQVAGITAPSEVNGVQQMPFDGISFADSFTDPQAPSRHTE